MKKKKADARKSKAENSDKNLQDDMRKEYDFSKAKRAFLTLNKDWLHEKAKQSICNSRFKSQRQLLGVKSNF